MGTLATRLSATAAAIGLVGGVLATSSAVAAVPSAPAAPAVPASGSIPFSVADPDTAPRPVVTVAIGGVPLLLLLDTGSTGIRVAADKIPDKAVAVTGAAAAYGYGSGIQLHGDQADADVAIGEGHTGPLPIELVRSTDCLADKPDCPAAHGVKPAMFGGVLDGIMGVSAEEISVAKGPIRFGLEAGTVGFPVPAASSAASASSAATVPQQRGLVEAALAPAAVQPTPTPPPSPTSSSSSSPAPNPAPNPKPKPKHVTPKKNYPRLPFHTGKKARSLPDTGVPMSAALGAVTALTALLAGIGTVLAARRRPDHES